MLCAGVEKAMVVRRLKESSFLRSPGWKDGEEPYREGCVSLQIGWRHGACGLEKRVRDEPESYYVEPRQLQILH